MSAPQSPRAEMRRLRADVLARLAVTSRRLDQRIQETSLRLGPMSRDEALYLIAHQSGLDVARYLGGVELERVRAIARQHPQATVKAGRQDTKGPMPRTVPIDSDPAIGHLRVTSAVLGNAKEMARVYSKMYLLENSLRSVIGRTLGATDGKGWWEKCVSGEVQRKVAERKAKESTKPWHGGRGAEEIHYTDFGDLRGIIERNWPKFEGVIQDRAWVAQRLQEIEPSRNVVAHSNPLGRNDQTRLELYFNEWQKVLRDRGHLIP